MIEYLIAGGITGAAAHLLEKDPVIGAGIGLALFWAGAPAQDPLGTLPEPIRVPAIWYHNQVSRLAGGTPQVSSTPPGQRRGDYVTGSGTPEDPIVVNFDRDTYSTWGTT